MMRTKFTRLRHNERIEIYKLLALNKSLSEIARTLNRNKSTISREVKPFGKEKYHHYDGERKAVYSVSDRRSGKTKMQQNPTLKQYVLDKLYKKWSPDQISVSLRKCYPENKLMQISHETIYLHIYLHAKKELKEMLTSELRQQRKYRGNVRRGIDKRTTISDAIRIDERPPEVEGREIPGHWEGDLIVGKDRASAIGTLVERSTRAVILVHLKNRDSKTVRLAFQKKFNALPSLMKKSMTYDNGVEMAQHKLFTKNTKVQVYFTHPYSPWERPTNENTNGLLRQYFPKGTDLSLISKERLQFVQDELNERPRRTLDYRTPMEVFDEMILNKMI
jgi:transposase, IS30 family